MLPGRDRPLDRGYYDVIVRGESETTKVPIFTAAYKHYARLWPVPISNIIQLESYA